MHGEGDRSGGGVAEVVLDGVRHGECAGLVGGLIAYGVAGNEHQSLERAPVILQIVLQAYSGVRTCASMLSAFGTEFAVVSAGGCSTMVPVDVPAAFATL